MTTDSDFFDYGEAANQSSKVIDLIVRRINVAIESRVRYRYVKPVVFQVGNAYQISSPCCSRNIDPEGGVIDIARLEKQSDQWVLFMRNHQIKAWEEYAQSELLEGLLDLICVDAARVFWPWS